MEAIACRRERESENAAKRYECECEVTSNLYRIFSHTPDTNTQQMTKKEKKNKTSFRPLLFKLNEREE
jgi:hypothetical protein